MVLVLLQAVSVLDCDIVEDILEQVNTVLLCVYVYLLFLFVLRAYVCVFVRASVFLCESACFPACLSVSLPLSYPPSD